MSEAVWCDRTAAELDSLTNKLPNSSQVRSAELMWAMPPNATHTAFTRRRSGEVARK